MSFDLRKYLAKGKLYEEEGFNKGSWEYLTDKEKSEFADEIFSLINNAYAPIGGNPNYQSPSNVDGSEGDANYLVIDFDEDPEFDAVVVDKSKPSGVKAAALGHDNSGPAKSLAVNFLSIMLNRPGHYIEVSGKLKDILLSKGVPLVTDEETIRIALKGKEIEMNNDGTYNRNLGGKMHTKTMMGNPKV
ncbi:MAG: hypothetical protein HKN40_08985 [Winogradskyella sp.]|uniref:hypothetical protein n=1 Tax=Winogradskyella sp. TaxID=1883156 RepID=UPI0017A49777|nr:hypothetical protein [Winogradskyella sp.]